MASFGVRYGLRNYGFAAGLAQNRFRVVEELSILN